MLHFVFFLNGYLRLIVFFGRQTVWLIIHHESRTAVSYRPGNLRCVHPYIYIPHLLVRFKETFCVSLRSCIRARVSRWGKVILCEYLCD